METIATDNTLLNKKKENNKKFNQQTSKKKEGSWNTVKGNKCLRQEEKWQKSENASK